MSDTQIINNTHVLNETPVSNDAPINKQDGVVENTDSLHSAKTFRHKFSPEVVKSLYEFSKIHQYEQRKIYNESWENWVNNNEELISTETRKLMINGYSGNVVSKMYKSARYYFRKKPTSKVEPKKRRKYSACSRELLDHMDEYIVSKHKSNDFKPSDNYTKYIEENKSIIEEECKKLKEENNEEFTNSQILDKIKKTFKNRYFQLIKNK